MRIGLWYSLFITIISIFVSKGQGESITRNLIKKLIYSDINEIRNKHHAPSLEESRPENNLVLMEAAQNWATSLADKARLPKDYVVKHPIASRSYISFCGYTEGELMLYKHTNPVLIWYNEKEHFPMGKYEEWSNFTSMLWRGSKDVACGIDSTVNMIVYVVCYYQPQGNVEGWYDENIFQENGDPYPKITKKKITHTNISSIIITPEEIPEILLWKYILFAAIIISTIITIIIDTIWPYLPE